MYRINLKQGGHYWEKENLLTQKDREGMYDSYKCKGCGLKGKSRQLGTIDIKGSYSKAKVQNCIGNNKISTKIKVIHCGGFSPAFGNILPDTEHEVVEPPEGYVNDHTGVWVMGVGEPVRLLPNEYETIE